MRAIYFGSTLTTFGILFLLTLAVAQDYPEGGYRHSNAHGEEQESKRMIQLKKFLEETINKLADHHGGRKLLDDEELERMEKRKTLVEAKIQRMEERDDSEMERMRRRSERRGRRSEL
jgi:hypothetical protein